jgi:hypothetical protein
VLALEDIEGREPAQPWRRPEELELVLETAARLERMLTPSPVTTEPLGEVLLEGINSWHLVRDEPPAGLDDWSQRHLDELVALEARVADAVVGDTLVHLDIRADNILLTADGRVYFVDWPHAHVGAAWVDAVAFAPSVAMQGGRTPSTCSPAGRARATPTLRRSTPPSRRSPASSRTGLCSRPNRVCRHSARSRLRRARSRAAGCASEPAGTRGRRTGTGRCPRIP